MLLDTSGLYCYLDKNDPRHDDAVSLLHSARMRLTHNYVVAELVALCNARGFDRLGTLDFVTELLQNASITFVWVEEHDHRAALDLLRVRRDKEYSLCDAVSFLLMRRHKLTDALTTDHHFEQEGFIRLLRA